MSNRVVVQQEEDQPVPAVVLANAIVSIDESMKKISKSGLTENAIVVLLHDSTKVARRDIIAVLHALDSLRKDYTTR